MDEARFLDKIVRQRRGGFCYELNGAFAWLLRELGYEVTTLSARVYDPEGTPGPDFDHMALFVNVDGESWIADVGFGDSFRAPRHLVPHAVQRDTDPRGIAYRLTEAGGGWVMWKRDARLSGLPAAREAWVPQYGFTLAPRGLDEYGAMCRHQQTSPESSFTRKVVCSKTTPEGRLTLSASTLIETTADGRVETAVSRADWYDVLRSRFGVVLPSEIVRWP
jgi:N-hydroxyarylamine O-acetyltransferase